MGGDLVLFIDRSEVAETAARLLNGLGYPSGSARWGMAVSDGGSGGFFSPAIDGLRGTLKVPGTSLYPPSVLLGPSTTEPSGERFPSAPLTPWRPWRPCGPWVRVVEDDGALVVHGTGWEGLREPADVIDVANSGTLMRLLPGLIALGTSCVCSPATRAFADGRWPEYWSLALMGATVNGRGRDAATRRDSRRPAPGIAYRLPWLPLRSNSCILLRRSAPVV